METSSVSSLFVEEKSEQEKYESTLERTPKRKHNRILHHSASKALDRYIRDYEKSQAVSLARSMTEMCTQTPLRRENLRDEWRKSSSLLEREIKIAQSLLPRSFSSSDDSMSMDELLMEAPHYDDDPHQHPRFLPPRRLGSSGLHVHRSSRRGQVGKMAAHIESGIPPPRERRRNLSRALVFSTDEESSGDSSEFLPSSTDCSVMTSSDEEAIGMEDVRRTWRLVDDLKCDAASPHTTINGRRKPPGPTLHRLIERLSAAAIRKEKKLRQSVCRHGNLSSLHCSDLESASGRESWSEEDSNQYLLNGVRYTPHKWKYNDLHDDTLSLKQEDGEVVVTSCKLQRDPTTQCDAALLSGNMTSSSSPSHRRHSKRANAAPDGNRTEDGRLQRNQSNADTSSCSSLLAVEQLSCGPIGRLATDGRDDRVDHPGGVDALKSMISALQDLTSKQNKVALDDVTMSQEDVGRDSLRRAMNHLEELKRIVGSQ